MDTKDKLVTLEDLKVVHDGVEALETRMTSAEADISDTVKKSTGGTFGGAIIVDRKDGTVSTEGWSGIEVGNSIAKGTANNSSGYIRVFGKSGYRTDINHKNNGEPSQNFALYLPNMTGTIALNENTFKYKGFLPTTTNLDTLIGVDNVGVFTIQGSAVNAPSNVAWCTLYCNVPDFGQQLIVTTTGLYTRSYAGSPRQWSTWSFVSIYRASGTLTAVSGVTLSEVQVLQRGESVMIKGYATFSSAIPVNTETKIFSSSGVSLPGYLLRTQCTTGVGYAWEAINNAYFVLGTDGSGFVRTGVSNQKCVVFCINYLVS